MKTIEQTRRELFEVWLLKHKPIVAADMLEEGSFVPEWMFEAWQASRAALCVKLPPEVEADDVSDHFGIDEDGMDMAVGISQMVNGAIRTCATFIHSVGVKTK